MIKRTVALRYSKALFDLDHNKANLQKRLDDFKSFQKILEEHPDFLKLLQSPQIDLNGKKKLLQDVIKKETDPLFFQFIIHLVEKRRLRDLNQIEKEFRLMVNDYLGIWEAKIMTAVPLVEEIEEKLKKKLEDFYHCKIKIANEVNPNIIGGAILVVANEMIDWSLSSRLKKMKESLLTTNLK